MIRVGNYTINLALVAFIAWRNPKNPVSETHIHFQNDFVLTLNEEDSDRLETAFGAIQSAALSAQMAQFRKIGVN